MEKNNRAQRNSRPRVTSANQQGRQRQTERQSRQFATIKTTVDNMKDMDKFMSPRRGKNLADGDQGSNFDRKRYSAAGGHENPYVDAKQNQLSKTPAPNKAKAHDLERRVPATVSHTSSKVARDDLRSNCNQTQEPPMRDLDFSKILHTDMQKYLDRGKHRHRALLVFKYPKNVQSVYQENMKNYTGTNEREKTWNLDQQKRAMKVAFNPPRRFDTSYGGFYQNSHGTGQVGSIDMGPERRSKPKGETEDNVPRAFVGVSSYGSCFDDFGTLPPPNKKAQKKMTAGYGDMKGAQSSYQNNYAGSGHDKHIKEKVIERARVKEYRKAQQAGNLKPSVPLPFQGESSVKKDYGGSKQTVVSERVLPFHMLVTPHGMKSHAKSSYQQMYDEKEIRACSLKAAGNFQ